MVLTASYIFLLILLLVFVIAVSAAIIHRLSRHFLKHAILAVTFPRGSTRDRVFNPQQEIEASQELYKRLYEMRIPFALEMAAHGAGEEIHFYIIMPRAYAERAKRQIEILVSDATVTQSGDYDLWTTQGAHTHMRGAYINQQRSYPLPLKTLKNANLSPFLPILRVMSGLKIIGEGAAIQWIVQPAQRSYGEKIGSLISRLNVGVYRSSELLDKNFIITPETIQLLEEKISQPLFCVNARVVVTADDPARARELSDALARCFIGTTGANYNEIGQTKPRDPDLFLSEFFSRSFDAEQQMILSASELATLFRFPTAATPAVKVK